jgi:WD40 repeat protein
MLVAVLAVLTAIVVTLKRRREPTIVNTVRQLAISVDGSRVVAAMRDGSVDAWRVESQHRVASLPPFRGEDRLAAAAISPDGRTIVRVRAEVEIDVDGFSSGDCFFEVVSMDSGTLLNREKAYYLEPMAYSADGRRLIVCDYIKNEWQQIDPRKTTASAAKCGPVNPNKQSGYWSVRLMQVRPQKVFALGNDNELAVWDFETGKSRRATIFPLINTNIEVHGLAVSPDGRYLAVLKHRKSGASTIELFDVETLQSLVEQNLSLPGGVYSDLKFFGGGKSLAVLGGTLEIYDAKTLQLTKTLTVEGFGNILAASRDGELLALESQRQIWLYDGKSLRRFANLRSSESQIMPLLAALVVTVAGFVVVRRRAMARRRAAQATEVPEWNP